MQASDVLERRRRRRSKVLVDLLSTCCGGGGGGDDSVEEVRTVVAFSRAPFDDGDPSHFQILLTLYKVLTGGAIDCPRYGSHWEIIGFQVKSVGAVTSATTAVVVFSLLLLLHIILLLQRLLLLKLFPLLL